MKGRFEEWYKDTIEVETITIDTLLEEEGFQCRRLSTLKHGCSGC